MFADPQSLVMFSGGKDSFLTACRLAEIGRQVELISFNNGAVVGEENIGHGVKRLQNRYGEDKVQFVGVYNTAALMQRVEHNWVYGSWKELGEKYPGCVNAQVRCLHCQTCMWLAAIAYAKAKGIKEIAAGYKSTDLFCTGMEKWIDRIAYVAEQHGIVVGFPLWETPEWGEYPEVGRDYEMLSRGFEPCVLEPKCLIGCPVQDRVGEEDMLRYFDDCVVVSMDEMIDYMVGVFKYIKLSAVSLERLRYEIPDGSSGVY